MSAIDENTERYLAAAHGMQTGVAYDHANGSDDGSPKCLRVGVNSALADISALAALLIAKGVISKEEYIAALADGMERERDRYERHIAEVYGVEVKLA